MGQDKALLRIEGRTLLARTVETVRVLTPDILIIGRTVLPDDCPPVRAEPDETPGRGPLAGLCQGLRLATGQHVLCVACDFPFLRPDVLQLLIDCIGIHDAAVPVIDGLAQPLQAIYALRILDTAERRLRAGSLSLQGLLSELRVRWVHQSELRAIDPSLRSLRGTNTPAEWREVTGQ
jgi:molybdopterin-guanine dinucleotide biosynthesis protein A